jgi:SWI/SNF-related matrix-associated actin-dependent regulator 1 of chromatin subfamily A
MTTLRKTPTPFQREGIAFLAANPHALLADEPGLGKTVQAIGAATQLGLTRVLVFCPASVRLGWEQELDECLGRGAHDGWEIRSYNSARMLNAELETRPSARWEGLVLDESHFLKTPDSQRTRAILGGVGKPAIASRATRVRWALSGTPVLNRPVELYPLFKSLRGDLLAPYDNYARYTQRFCGAFFDGRGLNVKRASNLEDLAKRLKPFMLRRTKAEVFDQLPEKIVTEIPLALERADLKAVLEAEEAIGAREAKLSPTQENFSQLGDMSTLLRLTGEAKVPAAAAFVDDLLETQDKVVVFARHRSVVAGLAAAIGGHGRGVVVYQGGMSDAEKKAAVDRFVAAPAGMTFIGNIQAAGTGINGLQLAASSVVFAELSWTPGEMEQCFARVDRMGQKSMKLNSYWLYAPGTLESAMLSVLKNKTRVIERLMEADPLRGLL